MSPRNAIRLASKILAAGLAVVSSTAVVAQSPAQAQFDDRFVFNVGTFVVGTNVKARLDGDLQTDNEEVDFDETFGLGNDATRWRVDALWRITPRHQLRFSYFNMSSSHSRTIDRDIEWGDLTFTAGGKVKAEFKTEVYLLEYDYAFIREPDYEIALGLGVHYSDMWLQLSGNATLIDADGNVVDQGFTSKSATAPAPLPMIGVRGTWVVSPHWVLDASGSFFKASYDVYDGSWFQARLGATWMYNNNFGLGAAYSHFRTNVDVDKDSFNGNLTTSYSGLQVFLTASF